MKRFYPLIATLSFFLAFVLFAFTCCMERYWDWKAPIEWKGIVVPTPLHDNLTMNDVELLSVLFPP